MKITGTMRGSLNRSNGRFVLHCITQYWKKKRQLAGAFVGQHWAQVPGKQSIVPCGQAHTSQRIFKSTLFTPPLTEKSDGD